MGFPVKKADVREMLRRHGEEEDVQRLEFDTFKRLVAGEHTQSQMFRAAIPVLKSLFAHGHWNCTDPSSL